MTAAVVRALVLSGGGSGGAYQVGAIEYLLGARGIVYDAYLGVSVGAVNAAHLAMFGVGKEAEAADGLTALWRSLDDSKVAPERFMAPVSLAWQPSLRDTSPLRALLESKLDTQAIKASGKKLRVIGVDLASGSRLTWAETDDKEALVRGILASAAAPIIYPGVRPVALQHQVDGGVRDVVPLRQAIQMGAEEIDVLLTTSVQLSPWKRDPDRVWNTALRAFDLMVREIVDGDLRGVDLHNSLIKAGAGRPGKRFVRVRVLRPDAPLGIDSSSFSPEGIARCIKLGRADAAAWMEG